MRIAAFPKGWLDDISIHRTMSVFDWIERAGALGCEGLELYEGFFWSLEDDFVEAVGQALEKAGFDMPMMCCSPDFTHPDPGFRRDQIERQARFIEITRALGGSGAACRVLSGQRHPGLSVEEGLERAAGAIRELLPLAHRLDVTLALENHYKDGAWLYPEFAQRRDVFLRLLDAIDDRTHFGVQYDPSNAVVAGDDPVDLLRAVIGRVVTMQASDRYLAPGASLDDVLAAEGRPGYLEQLRHGVIGQGMNDFDAIFSTLAAAGYNGWVSVEDGVDGLDQMRQSVEFLKQMREVHFGGRTDLSRDNLVQ
ncbi:MAG: sugar phosphate isomerase/epimerase [Propionibacteriaceae bacterium]|jgi:sugar phosphate isomerase/epimerase|nr:sugar phosphate isomerase/epimerase [Propionibacteriaceae bacterium]